MEKDAMAQDDDRRANAYWTQRYINARVLRELARLIEEWKAEEQAKKRIATYALVFLVVATGAAAVAFLF